MVKFIKTGRVVLMTSGRMAGKKALVVKTYDEGTRARPFGHCLVAGVARAPLKITKAMGKKKQSKRTKCKPFVKYVNYNHIMPTRYLIPADIDAKSLITDAQMDSADGKVEALKTIKKMFEEKMCNPPVDKAGRPDKN